MTSISEQKDAQHDADRRLLDLRDEYEQAKEAVAVAVNKSSHALAELETAKQAALAAKVRLLDHLDGEG